MTMSGRREWATAELTEADVVDAADDEVWATEESSGIRDMRDCNILPADAIARIRKGILTLQIVEVGVTRAEPVKRQTPPPPPAPAAVARAPMVSRQRAVALAPETAAALQATLRQYERNQSGRSFVRFLFPAIAVSVAVALALTLALRVLHFA
jgi:hypothetical protein